MSVYSRCVEARGTISIASFFAFRQAPNPTLISRWGSGAWVGGIGQGEIELQPDMTYGLTWKPYSDWTASAGTTGLAVGYAEIALNPPSSVAVSLSSAMTVATRLSFCWRCETAIAPRECPTIASLIRRPFVRGRVNRRRSMSFHSGLNRLTRVDPASGFG